MESLVGQTFGNWSILAKEVAEKYNYKFICKCTCGNKKVIRKHDLINKTYPKCNKCKSNSVLKTKMDLIQKRWNPFLNKIIPLEHNLAATKTYWFRCPEGHDYQSNILELNNSCPICILEKNKNKILDNYRTSYNDTIDYLDILWSELFEDIIIETHDDFIFRAINHDKKAIIVGVPKGLKKMDIVLYKSKQEWYNVNIKIKSLTKTTYEVFITELELDYRKDTDKLMEITRLIF